MQPPTPPGNRPVTPVVEKMKSWFHWLFVALLATAFALVLAANGMTLNLPGQPGWPEALLILLATVSTITALARQLPLQNVLLAAFVIALMGGAVHALGVTMGIPFGPFLFGAEAGPQFFKTLPWVMPLIWVAAILNSRGVVRLIFRHGRKINRTTPREFKIAATQINGIAQGSVLKNCGPASAPNINGPNGIPIVTPSA